MTPDEVRQEIEQTRQSLGQTVDELAAKADVKAMARAKAAQAQARARASLAEVSGRASRSQFIERGWPVGAAVGVLIFGSGLIWRWKRG
jgi:hypothetical protein